MGGWRVGSLGDHGSAIGGVGRRNGRGEEGDGIGCLCEGLFD